MKKIICLMVVAACTQAPVPQVHGRAFHIPSYMLEGVRPRVSGASGSGSSSDATKLPLAGGTLTGALTLKAGRATVGFAAATDNSICFDTVGSCNAELHWTAASAGLTLDSSVSEGITAAKFKNIANQTMVSSFGSGSNPQRMEAGNSTLSTGAVTVNFGVAFSAAPHCTCSNIQATPIVCGMSSTAGTSSVSFAVPGGLATHIEWICIGDK